MKDSKEAHDPLNPLLTDYPYAVIDTETGETVDIFPTMVDAGRCANEEVERLGHTMEVKSFRSKPGDENRWEIGPDGIARVTGRAS